MRIAITGAMGVGKTTLANELGKELGYKILPEVARELAKLGHKLDEGITEATEYEIIMMQSSLEQKHYGPWIADRCLIDTYAYCLVLFKKNVSIQKIVKREMANANYDLIIYLPPEFPIVDDGVRSTDRQFQKQIDQSIRNVLKGFNYHTITGGINKRKNKILQLIKKSI